MATGLSEAAASVWAKSPDRGLGWLPLWRHLDDSAAVAGKLWDTWLPAATKQLIAQALPDGEVDGRLLAVWLAGIHDIGKATPAFAVQVRSLAARMRDRGLAMPHDIPYQDRKLARHATTGQLLLEQWLQETHQWEARNQSRQFAIVVGGHHGTPPEKVELRLARERRSLLGLGHDQTPWQLVHRELLDRAAITYGVADRLPHWGAVKLSQPAQVLLTALVIVADWIASNEELFPYDPDRLHLPSRLDDAWVELDLPTPWRAVPTAESPTALLTSRFGFPPGSAPYPIQTAAVELSRTMPAAGMLVVEAPMGEGKTEAALAAAEQLAASTGAGGCFVALPTRATSDAMFPRMLSWLERVPDADLDRGALAVMLAHGKARFQEDFTNLSWYGRSARVEVDGVIGQRDLGVHRWLRGRKKAMLSSFVVGTVDQLLFGSLQSRHLALRHLGLAGKVVIIDEAHAYDVYMSQYLDRALEWLAAYRVPTIVLSATLPARRRKEMIQAYDRGRGLGSPSSDQYAVLDGDIGYPVLVASGQDGTPTIRVAQPSSRQTTISLSRADDEPATLAALLRDALADGGCALVVRNTVRRVQAAAAHLRAALAGTGIEVSVAHSRFLAPDRAENDSWLRKSFGSPEYVAREGGSRPKAHVVVASQVAEQSLDIDFDLLLTDLAPVDLLLQRAGRLHRHLRGAGQSGRPAKVRQARCVLTGVDWSASPPEPASGSVRVYGRYPLLRSTAVLEPYLGGDRSLQFPTDIARLVQTAYGDDPAGPVSWEEVMAQARHDHDEALARKESKARTFRLGAVGPAGEPIVGWLSAGVGDAEDDPKLEGRRQVRDTAAESVEVLVLVRQADGTLVTPPWLTSGDGREVPTEHAPSNDLSRIVATCTLALPIELCGLETIEELERRNHFPGWSGSPWLAEELVLVLDGQGEAELTGHHLRYTREDGLVVTRLARTNA